MAEPLSDDRIALLLDEDQRFKRAFKPEAVAKLINPEITALAVEVQRHRDMLRRLETLEGRLRNLAMDHWAAELRAAMSGIAYLYRCPEHGDLRPLSQLHAHGVCCGRVDVVRGKLCSKTAYLVGEVPLP